MRRVPTSARERAFLAFACLALIAPHALDACTCKEKASVADELKQSSVVVKGKVTEIRDQYTWWDRFRDRFRRARELEPEQYYRTRGFLITVEVNTSWKGGSSGTIQVLTGRGGSDCGIPFVVGKGYLIYAGKLNGSEIPYTSICNRTAPDADAADDVRTLDQLRDASVGPR